MQLMKHTYMATCDSMVIVIVILNKSTRAYKKCESNQKRAKKLRTTIAVLVTTKFDIRVGQEANTTIIAKFPAT